jgi:hypothetical protein
VAARDLQSAAAAWLGLKGQTEKIIADHLRLLQNQVPEIARYKLTIDDLKEHIEVI